MRQRRFLRRVPGVDDELGGDTVDVGAAVGHDTVIPLCLRVFGVGHGNDGVGDDARRNRDRRKGFDERAIGAHVVGAARDFTPHRICRDGLGAPLENLLQRVEKRKGQRNQTSQQIGDITSR